MHLFPDDLYALLEFDKLLELTADQCVGSLGRTAMLSIKPSCDPLMIQRQLLETKEYIEILSNHAYLREKKYYDNQESLRFLAVEGAVLSSDGLQKLMCNIFAVQDWLNFFEPTKQSRDLYPHIFLLWSELIFDEVLLNDLRTLLDDEGWVRPDATKELKEVHRLQQSKRLELDKKFRRIAQHYIQLGYLKENVESFRNGRRVLSVFSEKKRMVRGIIHDESSTGKTAYIEPDEVIEINNDIFDLNQRYEKEVYRIIRSICEQIRPNTALYLEYQKLLCYMDQIQAKAQISIRLGSVLPEIKDTCTIELQAARHPLLLLKNNELDIATVPFSLKLDHKNRILMLSGPNAGGKSVCMKALGLLQLMFQCGMPLPVDEGTSMGIFKQLFLDMGDQQSLEDDLSTYSSRLKNAAYFLSEADSQTLILIDEFGSGTDPKIGGAIAEAMLYDLNKRKVFALITTHYSNLKFFAFNQPGLINAAMVFDKEKLSPTYQLSVGNPGSSYAFEIAQKSGIEARILRNAKKNAGKKLHNVEDLLIGLQKEQKQVADELISLEAKQKKLDQLIHNYESAFRDLEFSRKKMKLQIKEQSYADTDKQLKELQKFIKDLKNERSKEKALKAAESRLQATKIEKDALLQQMDKQKGEIYDLQQNQTTGQIEVGANVKLRNSESIGQIKSIDGDTAVVSIGNFTLKTPLHELELIGSYIEINKQKSINTNTLTNRSKFDTKIDIRGTRFEDALDSVEAFLDRALIENVNEVSIIHGKGNGVLRNLVLNKIKEYSAIKHFYHPPQQEGGNGLTVIEMG